MVSIQILVCPDRGRIASLPSIGSRTTILHIRKKIMVFFLKLVVYMKDILSKGRFVLPGGDESMCSNHAGNLIDSGDRLV